ncbi:MAG TPA: hypothetical protein PLR83_00285 [Pyrinomonadaceae bacterium]|nr:hypothetical protein [Pyrinomonadaceae bacterium]
MSTLSEIFGILKRYPRTAVVGGLFLILIAFLGYQLVQSEAHQASIERQNEDNRRTDEILKARDPAARQPIKRASPDATPWPESATIEPSNGAPKVDATDPDGNDRIVAMAIAKRTRQDADEILASAMTYTRKTNDIGRSERPLSRAEFLYLITVIVDGVEKEPKLRKRFTVDQNGKYDFDQLATAAFLMAMSSRAAPK